MSRAAIKSWLEGMRDDLEREFGFAAVRWQERANKTSIDAYNDAIGPLVPIVGPYIAANKAAAGCTWQQLHQAIANPIGVL
jgi:hypothetical protein